MIIPFVPFPLKKAIKRARIFKKPAKKLLHKIPKLKIDLVQARIDVSAEDYLSVTIFSTLFWFVVFTGLMSFLVWIIGKPFIQSLQLIFTVSLTITTLSFFYLTSFPGVQAKHRSREMEGNLLFAVRHMLISVKSGITLFDAMAGVGRETYGIVSDEFRKMIKEIHSGQTQERVLEKTAIENPSPHFRSVIWQISNALRAGADIAVTLDSIVLDLERDQFASIKKYNSEMNPLSMMYMMLAVILPSLGITFLMILSGFMEVSLGSTIFYFILVFILFFQVFFLSFIKTKRPVVGV
jgi:flagellar protein FlaJ